MTKQITVFAYNVLFGDGLLVEVPDRGTKRFILIDVGNMKGSDQALVDALADVKEKTGGHIDLYIMTHEHLDHVLGLKYAADHGVKLEIDHLWMTASAAPNYYEENPDGRRQLLLDTAHAFAGSFGLSAVPDEMRALAELNLAATADCVDFIRTAGKHVHYLYRGADIGGAHPFKELKLRVLAPEQNTSDYYGRSRTPSLALAPASVADLHAAGRPAPLPGIDGGAFYDLMDQLTAGPAEAFLAIDKAANNTSLVVEMTWRGRRLLFAGDAEMKSWQFMADRAGLQPVDFLKVGHHGSVNATPDDAILDEVLPVGRKRQAQAVVSTCDGAYNDVPQKATLARIRARTRKLFDTRAIDEGKPCRIAIREGT